jgi:hypothetical protein
MGVDPRLFPRCSLRRLLSALLLLLPMFLTGAPAFAASRTPTPDAKATPPPFYLAETKGKVFLITWDAVKKQAVRNKAKAPCTVHANDRIVTEKDSRAYFQFKDGGTVEVGPKSDLFVREIDVNPKTFRARFLLTYGRMKASVKKMTGARSTFEVEAGGVVAGVRGTTFGVEYDPEQKKTVTQTFEGTIFTLAGGKERLVKEGFSLALSGNKALSGALGTGEVKDFTEFMTAAGGLEKKKELLLKQLEKQLLKKLTGSVVGQGVEEGKKALQFGF